jgi:hypothetical protein
VTRYATVRLLTAAVFAVLVVGGATAWIYAAGAGVDVETLLLTGVLGLLSFAALVMLLLFDSRRRHQLMRVLRSRLASGRLLLRDRGVDDEARAEMKRRLEYALEGLRSAVATTPAPAGAAPGPALFEESRRTALSGREVARELPASEAQHSEAQHSEADHMEAGRASERVAVVTMPAERAPAEPRLPVSPHVAHGAPLVRFSSGRYQQSINLAAARGRLIALRQADARWIRRATLARWAVRAALLLTVPAVLIFQARARTSWFGEVWDSIGGRVGLVAALALGLAGSVWAFTATRRGGSVGPLTKGESHAVRSLFAAEQLTVRLALGAPPALAWRAAALTNHFPVGSATPAASTEEALELVEQLRGVARRRRHRPVRWRLKAIAGPLLTCILPASVIILLL